MKYPNANEYYNAVQALLDHANEWVISIESIYTQSKAHAISSSQGDLTSLDIFSDHANKTI